MKLTNSESMKLKWKILIMNWLSSLCIIGILVEFAVATKCIDFKKMPLRGIVTIALAAIGASTIAYRIEKWLWNKYIKKLKEKYERQKKFFDGQDGAVN